MPATSPLDLREATSFAAQLEATAYHQIAVRSEEAKTPLDHYLVCRSQTILGLSIHAERSLDRMEMKVGARHLLSRFVRAQLPAYGSNHADESLTQLLSLATEEFPSDYLRGEYHFVLGYVHNLLDEYRQGIRHHKLACDFYAKAGLRGCEAVAWFNLCVSYNHLAERALFENAFANLSRLADSCDSARLMCDRMRVYRAVDTEDFHQALHLTTPLVALCRRLGRSRDYASLVSVRAFLLLKTKQSADFQALTASFRNEMHTLPQEFSAALAEYSLLAAMTTFTAQDTRKTMTRWNQRQVPSVHRLFLYSLICDKLMDSRDYQTLARISHQASQLSIRKQQTLCLVDFRYYEILALIRIRQPERAQSILNLYRSDAEADGSLARLKKSADLATEMGAKPQDTESAPIPTEGNLSLVVDPIGHHVEFAGRQIDLSRKPLLTRFLAILIEAKEPIPIPELFERLYDQAFDPILHERRFNSIIDRTRAALGDSWAILRREGRIRINPQYSAVVKNGPSVEPATQRRRSQLLKALSSSVGPLTISDLESRFPCCRRTLQLDLKHLIEVKSIAHSGRTRDRAYFPVEHSKAQ